MTKEQVKKYLEDCNHRENGEDVCNERIVIKEEFKQRKIDSMQWIYNQ